MLTSIRSFYLIVNGRSLANFIIMTFVYLGKDIFDYFNALAFVLLIGETYILARNDGENDPIMLAAIAMMLWFLLPVPNQTLFWQCGAVVYLWMAVLCLAFVFPLKRLFTGVNFFEKHRIFGVFSIFLLGVLAGDSHELIAPVLFVISAWLLVFLRRKKRTIPPWLSVGVFGLSFGIIAQYIAPSNYVKFDNVSAGIDYVTLLSRPWDVFKTMLAHQALLWFITFLIFVLYFFEKKYLRKKKTVIDAQMFVMALSAALLCLMGVIYPYFPPRAFFFSSVFLILFIARFLVIDELIGIKKIAILLFVPACVISIGKTVIQSGRLDDAYKMREATISEQLESGSRELTVKGIKNERNVMLMGDSLLPPPDKNYWASRFYGVDSIRLLK